MKTKFLPTLSTTMLALTLLAGCSNGGGETKITITVWDDQSNQAVVEQLCKEFVAAYNSQYPLGVELEIVFQEQAEGSAVEKMQTVSATGNGPDVVAITHDTLANAVRTNLLDPSPYAAELEEIMSDDAINAVSAIDSVTNESIIYGYPITAESMTLLYDKNQLSATDVVSMDSLLASGKQVAWEARGDEAGYYMFGLLNDANLFGEDGKDPTQLDLATDNSVNNIVSMFNDYRGALAGTLTPDQAISLINVGQIAGVVTSPYLYSQMVDAFGADRVGVATLPTINGQDMRPFSGYKAYAVSRYSEYPDISHALAKYLVEPEQQLYRLVQSQYLPAVDLSDTSDPTIQEIVTEINNSAAVMKVFQDSLDKSIVMPNIEQMATFWAPVNNAIGGFWDSTTDLTADGVRSVLTALRTEILG